nr:tetratricopeptide repeat protein [Aulosira sp. DedVER01a]
MIDWDKDFSSERDEEYQALVRTLNFTEGFGLLFIRCSPAEGEDLIIKVKEDINNKNIEVLRLDQTVDNLYEIIDKLSNKENIDCLFITGLEHSFYEYEECKSLMGWNSRDIYSYSWKGVPPVLINLNQQRERFKDNFNICFVFLLPIFAIKYFLQRAPDFFDWRSGLFEFPIDSETLEQESSRIIQDGDDEKYLNLTPEERTQAILVIQELIAEDHQTPARQCDLLINLGKLQSAGQNYKEAIANYDKALEIEPDYHEARLNQGIALGNLGRNEEALASFDKALEFKPDYQVAWLNRGNALDDLGRYEEAIASFDKALEFKPDYQLAWYNRGIALRNLGRYEEALANYDQALEFKPDDHLVWLNQGNALDDLGRYEEALTSFDKALEFKPDYQDAWNNQGIALRNLGRYEEALASYNKALEFKPDDHLSWNNRGNALFNLGRSEEAIASYDKALEFQPDDRQAWFNRGYALFNLGCNEEAITAYDKAMEIQPYDYLAWYNKRVISIKLQWQKLMKPVTQFLQLIGFRR